MEVKGEKKKETNERLGSLFGRGNELGSKEMARSWEVTEPNRWMLLDQVGAPPLPSSEVLHFSSILLQCVVPPTATGGGKGTKRVNSWCQVPAGFPGHLRRWTPPRTSYLGLPAPPVIVIGALTPALCSSTVTPGLTFKLVGAVLLP